MLCFHPGGFVGADRIGLALGKDIILFVSPQTKSSVIIDQLKRRICDNDFTIFAKMNKKQLRLKYKNLREALYPELIKEKSISVAKKLLQLPIWDRNNFLVFLSIKNKKEVNTRFIIKILEEKKKKIILPKSDFTQMHISCFLLEKNTEIETNSYGIPEPKGGITIAPNQIEVIFVPLLAFDKRGYRVGYGKGFYDRFFKLCSPSSLKIGLSFFEPEDHIDDICDFDIKLDYLANPYGLYDFKV